MGKPALPESFRHAAGQAANAEVQPVREQHAPAQFLSFSAAGSTFSVGVTAIQEFTELRSVSVLPLVLASVRGVIDLRDSVLPVNDLNVRLSHALGTVAHPRCIANGELLRKDRVLGLGLPADSVTEIMALGPQDPEPQPRSVPSFGDSVVRLWQGLSAVEVSRPACAQAQH